MALQPHLVPARVARRRLRAADLRPEGIRGAHSMACRGGATRGALCCSTLPCQVLWRWHGWQREGGRGGDGLPCLRRAQPIHTHTERGHTSLRQAGRPCRALPLAPANSCSSLHMPTARPAASAAPSEVDSLKPGRTTGTCATRAARTHAHPHIHIIHINHFTKHPPPLRHTRMHACHCPLWRGSPRLSLLP